MVVPAGSTPAPVASPASLEAATLLDPPVEPFDVPFDGERSRGTWCVPPPGWPTEGPRPTLVCCGRIRLERRGALLPAGCAWRRAWMERLRLRRTRSARMYANEPGPHVPARLRGADRRGTRRRHRTGPGRRRAGGPRRPELRFVLRGPLRRHGPPGLRAGGESTGCRHGSLHGGMGRDRRLPDGARHPPRRRDRSSRGPDAPPDAVGDRSHLHPVRCAVLPRLAGRHGGLSPGRPARCHLLSGPGTGR